jgi:hypothetical protein
MSFYLCAPVYSIHPVPAGVHCGRSGHRQTRVKAGRGPLVVVNHIPCLITVFAVAYLPAWHARLGAQQCAASLCVAQTSPRSQRRMSGRRLRHDRSRQGNGKPMSACTLRKGPRMGPVGPPSSAVRQQEPVLDRSYRRGLPHTRPASADHRGCVGEGTLPHRETTHARYLWRVLSSPTLLAGAAAASVSAVARGRPVLRRLVGLPFPNSFTSNQDGAVQR